MAHKLRILVVDDMVPNRSLICRFVSTLGHDAIPATNGADAVEICRHGLPDIVLMDIMMPVMDGYQASMEIRQLAGQCWLPIIFLSAKGSEVEQVEGLGIGDDYLPKPVNLVMLEAKIKVMARIAEMQQRLAENAERLEAYRQDNEQEQRLTRHILERIIGHSAGSSGSVKRWIKPAHNLSGDVIAHGYSPSCTLNLLLADSTGHGLAAAIGAVPAADAFLSMTRRGYDIGAIAREINAKLHRLLPTEHFVSAAFISVDSFHERVSIWNGGIPSVLLVDVLGNMVHQWPSAHPPLGILPDGEFDSRMETYQWEKTGEIFVFSDGVTEAENESGEQFGWERLATTLAEARGHKSFEKVKNAINSHLGSQENHDDISLASIVCSPALYRPFENQLDLPFENRPFQAGGWVLSLHFSARELTSQDSRPLLVNWLNQLGLNVKQFGELLIILTELFNNALDHGVLQLDSSLKQSPQGFEAYIKERETRIKQLDQGYIEVNLEHTLTDNIPTLRLKIRDSGVGFDHAQQLSALKTNPQQFHGRGLTLVRQLAPHFHFEANGTEAVVEYPLQENYHDRL